MTGRILIAEDREGIRIFIAEALRTTGLPIDTAADGQIAMELLNQHAYTLLITDIKMPNVDGMALLHHCRKKFPNLPVVVLTAHGTIKSAVEAIKIGAFDYLTKPLDSPGALRQVAFRALAQSSLSVIDAHADGPMITHDPIMKPIVSMILKVAPTDATVLLTGQSGTGKEMAARQIHINSKRKSAPFIAVNCAAISIQLVESELFGHEKGAFTGATESRQGRFELADEGTLFLDEVGELPLELQAKLLRVIQEQQFERVGGTRSINVNVRLIAATNQDLLKNIQQGTFREDLYHRLSVFPIELPMLRERPGDIVPLANHLLKDISARLGQTNYQLSQDAVDVLKKYHWPGNVRELGNVLERGAIMANENILTPEDLVLISNEPKISINDDTSPKSLKSMEKEAIIAALAANDGHRAKAAKALSIGLRTLYNKIKEYNIG